MKEDVAFLIHVLGSCFVPFKKLGMSLYAAWAIGFTPAQPREGLFTCFIARTIQQRAVIWIHVLSTPLVHMVWKVEPAARVSNAHQDATSVCVRQPVDAPIDNSKRSC